MRYTRPKGPRYDKPNNGTVIPTERSEGVNPIQTNRIVIPTERSEGVNPIQNKKTERITTIKY